MKWAWLWLSFSPAFSLPLDQAYLAELRKAQKAEQILVLRQKYLAIQADRRICRVQLKTQVIPWVCYRLMRREVAWKLKSKEAVDLFLKEVNGQCRQVAQHLLHIESGKAGFLAFDVPMSALSPDCLEALAKAKDITLYRRSGTAAHGPDFEYLSQE